MTKYLLQHTIVQVCKCFIFVWRNTRMCLHALTAGQIPIISKLLHVLQPSFEHGPYSVKAIPPPTIVLSVPTTGPWPTHQKRIGTSHVVSHTQQSSQPILSMNKSPLGTSHWCIDRSALFALYLTSSSRYVYSVWVWDFNTCHIPHKIPQHHRIRSCS